jgi:hypothetical protein
MEMGQGGDAFNELVARGVSDLQQAQELLLKYTQAERQSLENWAGNLLHRMFQDRTHVETCLTHEDAMVRVAALLLLKNYWALTADTANSAERVALNDPDPRVRGVAIMTLLRAHDYASDSSKELVLAIMKPLKERDLVSLETESKVIAEAEPIVKDSARRSEARKRKLWEALAGPALGKLLISRRCTEDALSDHDPKLRMAGLLLLCDYWPRQARLSELCETMAFEDPNPEVRSLAIGRVAALHEGSNDGRVGALLARLVSDELKPHNLRRAAYCGLFRLRGAPIFGLHRSGVLKGEMKFPEDCDWAFVNSFLQGNFGTS